MKGDKGAHIHVNASHVRFKLCGILFGIEHSLFGCVSMCVLLYIVTTIFHVTQSNVTFGYTVSFGLLYSSICGINTYLYLSHGTIKRTRQNREKPRIVYRITLVL